MGSGDAPIPGPARHCVPTAAVPRCALGMGVGHSVPRDIRAQLCPYGSCPTVCWDTALLPAHRVEDRRVQDQVAQCQQTPQITIITIRIFNKNSMQSSKLCPDLHSVGRLHSPSLGKQKVQSSVVHERETKPGPSRNPPTPPSRQMAAVVPAHQLLTVANKPLYPPTGHK